MILAANMVEWIADNEVDFETSKELLDALEIVTKVAVPDVEVPVPGATMTLKVELEGRGPVNVVIGRPTRILEFVQNGIILLEVLKSDVVTPLWVDLRLVVVFDLATGASRLQNLAEDCGGIPENAVISDEFDQLKNIVVKEEGEVVNEVRMSSVVSCADSKSLVERCVDEQDDLCQSGMGVVVEFLQSVWFTTESGADRNGVVATRIGLARFQDIVSSRIAVEDVHIFRRSAAKDAEELPSEVPIGGIDIGIDGDEK